MSKGLILDFSDKERIVGGNNDVFEGTPLQGKQFKFFVKPVDGDTLETVRRKHTKLKGGGREERNSREVEKELFIRQVTNWEGLVDKSGELFPCTSENKKLFANEKYMLASMVNMACLNMQVEDDEVKEEELKN